MARVFANPFVWEDSKYQRDINPLKHAVEDSAKFLSVSTGYDLAYCEEYVRKSLRPGGQFAFKDLPMTCLVRQENGDRVKVETTLTKYLGEAIKNKELIAPTLTTYVHPEVEESLLVQYIDNNIKLRSAAKKEEFKFKAVGDAINAMIKNLEQTGRKLSNNAISGGHVSDSTPIYNPTAHSTLTSNCRSTSGYGNANNEKFLSGNRHYFNHHIVLNNIVSIINHTDYDKLKAVMEKYQLHYPTHAEVLSCIHYSVQLYWRDDRHWAKIERLVKCLSPLECAAFVYTGDLYHLMKYNNAFVRNMFSRFVVKATGPHADPIAAIKAAPDAYVNLAHLICRQEVKGIGKDYTKARDPMDVQTLANTVENLQNVVMDYADLIDCLWVTTNLPASVAHFPTSIRRAALTSDTDSTIFTVQDWVIWYKGELSFDDEATAVANTAVFLAASTIYHILAIMSANFGIVTSRIHQIEMKNEFYFPVFVPTQQGKHYYAAMTVQEGYVFSEHEIEIKGVQLKNSNSPKPIREAATAMMEEIMERVMRGEKLQLAYFLKKVADIEREIVRSIRAGEPTYLRAGSIKDAESYTKNADESPYAKHEFWQRVFGPQYGEMPPPPYNTMKFSLTTDTATKFKNWLNGLENQDFAQRMREYCISRGKALISSLDLPSEILMNSGFPKEIMDVIDYRKIVGDICRVMYLILETLGVYMYDQKVKRLVSDYY